MFGHANEIVVDFDEKDNQDWVKTNNFLIPFDYWRNKLYNRRDVFLAYCSSSSSTAAKVKEYLMTGLGATVLDWQTDFSPTDTILNQIEQATARCNAGIFLFTKDDFLKEKKTGANAIPRDNVVFEAGFFIHAKGNSQVLIILEDGAKMPADLGGKIYASLPDKASIIPVKPVIKKFIDGF
jgi:predicted nucleotide-binding protein